MSTSRVAEQRKKRTDWARRTRDGGGRFAAGDVTDPRARFDEKVDKSGDCWLWNGNINKQNGYGQFWLNGRSVTAHRASYILTHGAISGDLVVDHMCHVRLCVRPSHLQAVTTQQNIENRAGANANSKSGVRGVCWATRDKRWIVQLTVKGKLYRGGRFTDLDEARKASIALRNNLCTNSLTDRQAAA